MNKSNPKLFTTTTREFSKVAGGWSCSYCSLHHIGTEFVVDTVNSRVELMTFKSIPTLFGELLLEYMHPFKHLCPHN